LQGIEAILVSHRIKKRYGDVDDARLKSKDERRPEAKGGESNA
jgi:hypothetical protein